MSPSPIGKNGDKSAFPHLQGHQFMSLTTFRKSGAPVPTPVWFAQVDGVLYALTLPDSGKVKRIRNNAQVEVTPCNARGELLGAAQEGMARILPPDDSSKADKALSQKYGLMKRLMGFFSVLRGKHHLYLEISPM